MAPRDPTMAIPSCITVTRVATPEDESLVQKRNALPRAAKTTSAPPKNYEYYFGRGITITPVDDVNEDPDFEPSGHRESVSSDSSTDASSSNASDYVEEVKLELEVLEDLEMEDEAFELIKDQFPTVSKVVDYASSFTISQLALGLAEVGLSTFGSILTGGATAAANLARSSRVVRRHGARMGGEKGERLLNIANSTGVNFLLGLAGMKLKVRREEMPKKTLPTEDDLIEHAEGIKQLSDEMLENYFSGDSDFVPDDGAAEEESSESDDADEDGEDDVEDEGEDDESLKPVVVRVEMAGEEKLEDLGESGDVIFEEGHCLPKIKEEPVEEGEDTVEMPSSLEAKDVVGKIVTETLDESLKCD